MLLCQADWLSEAQLTFFLNAFTFPTPASLIYFLTASHPLFCSIKPLIWIWRAGDTVYCSAESSSIIRDATDLSELCVRLCGFMRFCNRTHSVRSSSPVPSLRYQKLIRQYLDSVRGPLMYLLWLIVLPALPLKSSEVWSNHGPLWRTDRAIFSERREGGGWLQ